MTKAIKTPYKSALLLTLLFLPFISLAQSYYLNQTVNVPKEGDIIKKELLPYVFEGQSGENQIWDYSNLTPTGHLYFSYAEQGDTILCIDEDGIKYYSVDENGLWQSGYENELEEMNYSQSIPLLRFPLSYGDRHSDVFEGEGLYCKTHFVRHCGSRQIKADAVGTLILPESDTLRNALRVSIVTTSFLRISKDSLLNDLDNQKQIVTEQYQWFVPGLRYPVFETLSSTSYHDFMPVASRKYSARWLPSMQYEPFESPNGETSSDTENQESSRAFTYDVHNEHNIITVSYCLTSAATIRVIVADAMGMLHKSVEQSQPAGQGYEMTIDCRGLRHGQYVVYINVNGTVFNHKVTIE